MNAIKLYSIAKVTSKKINLRFGDTMNMCGLKDAKETAFKQITLIGFGNVRKNAVFGQFGTLARYLIVWPV